MNIFQKFMLVKIRPSFGDSMNIIPCIIIFITTGKEAKKWSQLSDEFYMPLSRFSWTRTFYAQRASHYQIMDSYSEKEKLVNIKTITIYSII